MIQSRSAAPARGSDLQQRLGSFPTASILALFMVLLPTHGCIPVEIDLPVIALHPPSMDGSSEAAAKLMGTWQFDAGSGEMCFTTNHDGNCELRVVAPERTSFAYVLHEALGDGLLLDLFPTDYPDEFGGDFAVWLPAHIILRIPALGDTIELQALSYSWLDSLLLVHPEALESEQVLDPHKPRDEPLRVVTASGEALRAFIETHQTNPAAWYKLIDDPLIRVPDPVSAGAAKAE